MHDHSNETRHLIEGLQREVAQLREQHRRSRPGRLSTVAVALGALVGGGALSAAAQGVADNLVTFKSGDPAVAEDVNWNFTLLREWIEAKVGTVGKAATIDTTGSIKAGSLTSTGYVTTTSGTASAAGERHGFRVTGSSDSFFVGQEARADDNNSYDAVIAWGDDQGDKLRFESNQCCGRGDQTALSLDYEGNATFAGKVTATDLTVSGTLFGGRTSVAVGTNHEAATDGFVIAHIRADHNGDRCEMLGKIDGVTVAADAAHWYSNNDTHVYRGSIMMPVPRGATYRVNVTESSGTCAKAVSWVPLAS